MRRSGTTVQKRHSLPDARFGIHVDGCQAGVPVNGHKQQAALAPQLRQVLDVDVEIARGIAFEAFGCWRLSRQRSSTFCGSAFHPPANDTHCLFRCVEYEAAAHGSGLSKTRWISSTSQMRCRLKGESTSLGCLGAWLRSSKSVLRLHL